MKQRLAPFLILLEARYAPLLFAVAPQAYNVYRWLFPQPYDGYGEVFAVIGALGFEAVYVGAIAWAEERRAGRWTWATAAMALIFSVAVAVYVHLTQGWWAVLHAGFPLVAFCYTMQLHAMSGVRRGESVESVTTPPESTALATTSAPLSRTGQVRQLAVQMQVSESTIWRKVKAGDIVLSEGEVIP